MNFELDEDQAMIKALAERFVADHYQSGPQKSGNSDARAALADTGLLGLPFAEEDGGIGGGRVEIMTVMEVFGRAYAAPPSLGTIMLGGRVLAAAGTDDQRARYLSRIMDGTHAIGFAFAEQGSRYSLSSIYSAVSDGKLDGHKVFATADVDSYVVTARDETGVGLFLVDAYAPGLERRDYRLVDGTTASELRCHAVPVEKMKGGLPDLDPILDDVRLCACAEMTGIMASMLASTLEYVRERRQFNTPIGSFQVVQHRMADLYARLELARSQLYRAALCSRDVFPEAVSAAKAFISLAAIRLGEECIQLHGGMGVSEELTLGAGHRRLLVLTTMLGDVAFETERYTAAARGGTA